MRVEIAKDDAKILKISSNNTSPLWSYGQMPYLSLFFFKYLNMKTMVKKNKKYDAGILKTSDLSTGIIFSCHQSRETIPLSSHILFYPLIFRYYRC